MIDMKPSETHCLGRHLVDLPTGSKVDARYKYMNLRIEVVQGVSKPAYQGRVASRQAELQRTRHSRGGNLFVERNDFSPTQQELVSWVNTASRLGHRSELFSYFEQPRVMFVFEGEGSASRLAEFTEYSRELAGKNEYRANARIPSGAGFCFDSGFVSGFRPTNEEVAASLDVPGYPSVTISYDTYVTGKPDQPLLSRVPRVPSMLVSLISGTRTVRRGKRNIGSIEGQELLVRGTEDGKRSYEFLWESQGRANSAEYPFMSLQLSTTSASDEEGNVIDAPFASDEEALALWDSILDSIRLRPGAVGR